MLKIRTLIVDDEPLGRERVRSMLSDASDIEIIGESADGEDAVNKIIKLTPDLVFLDIDIPGLSGLDVLQAIKDRVEMPLVVFITAYDEYATRAFEAHALDYLLKPFDEDRFALALNRVRTQLQRNEMAEIGRRMSSMLQSVDARPKYIDRLVVKSSGRVVLLPVSEIEWIEANGNYLHIHCGGESHLLRETMNSVEERLDPSSFIRIHRSTMVSISQIQELQPIFHGDYAVILRDGKQLTLSRGYRARVQAQLGAKF